LDGVGHTEEGVSVLKKTITYEDFNGDTVSEDFYFNLSKAELVELETSHKEGLAESIKKIIEDQDGAGIIREFKKIILKAYGKRSPDGRRFIKNQDIRDEFESTEAYSVLFMELVTDAEAAADFINAVVPHGLIAEDQEKLTFEQATPEKIADVVNEQQPVERPNLTPEPKKLSEVELREMDPVELKAGITEGRFIL
jgi:hypothetical protein